MAAGRKGAAWSVTRLLLTQTTAHVAKAQHSPHVAGLAAQQGFIPQRSAARTSLGSGAQDSKTSSGR